MVVFFNALFIPFFSDDEHTRKQKKKKKKQRQQQQRQLDLSEPSFDDLSATPKFDRKSFVTPRSLDSRATASSDVMTARDSQVAATAGDAERSRLETMEVMFARMMQNQEQLQRQLQQQQQMTSAQLRGDAAAAALRTATQQQQLQQTPLSSEPTTQQLPDLRSAAPSTAVYNYQLPAERESSPLGRAHLLTHQSRLRAAYENPAFVQQPRDHSQIYSTGSPLGGGLRHPRPATARSQVERRF